MPCKKLSRTAFRRKLKSSINVLHECIKTVLIKCLHSTFDVTGLEGQENSDHYLKCFVLSSQTNKLDYTELRMVWCEVEWFMFDSRTRRHGIRSRALHFHRMTLDKFFTHASVANSVICTGVFGTGH